jgi:hypothetical protein
MTPNRLPNVCPHVVPSLTDFLTSIGHRARVLESRSMRYKSRSVMQDDGNDYSSMPDLKD